MQETLIIGLTGGIGSGKSAAADRFVELGIHVVDADIASREVVKPGMEALRLIADHFGPEILQADGTLDRAQLRQVVFADPAQRKHLQSIMHPRINQYLQDNLASGSSAYSLLVNPLLFETRQHHWCQRTLVIDVEEATQVSRTMARDNNTQTQVENIMKAQLPRARRLELADDVIVNDKDLAALHAAVDQLHQDYLELAKAHC